MKYCKRCLYPDTKPDLMFNDDGVCSACIAYEGRDKNLGKASSLEAFNKIIQTAKDKHAQYDCIVPVSGGKDSHYQLLVCLAAGLRPLAVTATTDDLSGLGRRNLANITRLGVDHIEVTTNARLRRKINAYTLREVGDISWAEHVTIFTIPIREAVMRQIPLIVWGENPQHEYGGPEHAQSAFELDNSWLQEFGGLNGLRVSDVEQAMGISLGPQYRMPSLTYNTSGVFLGQFIPWNGFENAKVSQQNGFTVNPTLVEGTGVDYENLDNHQTGIHDYYKWLKFGFGRATDIVCNKIRRNLITREEGKDIILAYDGAFPSTYLGKPLERSLDDIGIPLQEFIAICDKFTNKDIFWPRHDQRPRPMLKKDVSDA